MMTITQAERLVRKIGDLLGQPAMETQAAKLAQDYAELARAANRRLEQCGLMIEAGEDLQALQLAETPPPLLDLITVLSFRQAAEWRAFCQGHNLPYVEPFYDKYVRSLNSTYGKGIASDHPFYRDYRRTVMKNEDDRALSILRVIARLNPADQNTIQELKRLEEKTVRGRLEELRQVVDAGDVGQTLARLEQIEASALPIPPNHPTWHAAQLMRCQHLLRQAQALQEHDAWEEAEVVLQDIRALADHYAVPLLLGDVSLWEALNEWTAAQRSAYVEEQDFQRALAALEYQADASEAKRNAGRRLGLPELQADYNSLAKKWHDVEQFNRPLDQALVNRSQRNTDWLQRRILGSVKLKRIMMVATTLVALAVVAALGFYFWNLGQEKQFLVTLNDAVSTRHVGDTERLLGHIPARLRSRSAVAQEMEKAKQFLSHETDLKNAFDQKFRALQGVAATNFSSGLDQIQLRRAECTNALAQLAPDLQSEAKNNLQVFDDRWRAQIGALQPTRNSDFGARLTEIEALAAAQLKPANGPVAVRTALPPIQSRLAALQKMQAQPIPLDDALVGRYHQLSNQVSSLAVEMDSWDRLRGTMPVSLEDHLARLKRLSRSPFATPAEAEVIASLNTLNISQTALLAGLLMPAQPPQAWESLTNLEAPLGRFRPEEPSQQEKDAYLTLLRDDNMQNIHVYHLTPNLRDHADNTNQPQNVFTQSKLTDDKAGKWKGRIYDPVKYKATLRFADQKIDSYEWMYSKLEDGGVIKDCEAVQRLGLNDLIDSNTGHYHKSILELLDQLLQETEASALFRAYMSLKLIDIAQMRPSEWGLQWSPSVALHSRMLNSLGAQNLHSGEWLVPNLVQKYDGDLEHYFQQVRTLSFEKEARFFQRLTRRACEAGFDFAGYVAPRGDPILSRTNSTSGELWGWSSRSRQPTLLFRHRNGADPWERLEDPLPFTPLWVFRGDRRKILDETAQTAVYPLRSADPVLPPLFADLKERH